MLKTRRANQKSAPKIVELNNNHQVIDETLENALQFLRTCVVTAEQMPIIQQKLISTSTYRRTLFENKNINLLEQFPYFFTNPELV